jgi:CRISPR-associated protein Cmr6
MPNEPLRRSAIDRLFDTASDPHPGLWLSRGLREWKADKTQKGKDFQKHIGKVASLQVSEIYKAAYERWHRQCVGSPTTQMWVGDADGRLFIGTGGPSVLESAITLSQTYGVPIIPGSAQKGVARVYAQDTGTDPESMAVLFGAEGDTVDSCESGYVIYHDAWWIPNATQPPLAQEVDTVHHPDFYQDGGATPATDFDSPQPNAQIAACGSFLFCVQCGAEDWGLLAIHLLAAALQQVGMGIGAKTNAGYGLFRESSAGMRQLRRSREHQARLDLPLKEQLRLEVEGWTEKKLAIQLGKKHNKNREKYGDDWGTFINVIAEQWGDVIKQWHDDQDKFRRRAFNLIYGR